MKTCGKDGILPNFPNGDRLARNVYAHSEKDANRNWQN